MKISLITTVKNEADNIEVFLDSVLKQSKHPNEFIIRDAGSTDGTIKIIKRYMKRFKWINLLVAPNTNIAQGRNLAINATKNKIIAVTDAGCKLEKNWLENITKPFENKNIDVVSGVYRPLYETEFQYYEGLVICQCPEKINTVSRMSSRSIAFRKKCWEDVGGYPEKYDIGEDTFFNIKLKDEKFNFVHIKDAVVYWEMRKTWKSMFKQFYRYGTWDRVSGNIFRLKRNLYAVITFFGLLALSVLFDMRFLILMSMLFVIDIFITASRIFKENNKIKSFLYGISILFVRRVAYFVGIGLGKASKY